MASEDGDTRPQGESGEREIGRLAVWSASTAKPGNGVELMRDGNTDTYWQSDGTQPHTVSIQFQKKVRIQTISMYLDYKQDESYTPNKISIGAGNSCDDLKEIKTVELQEPCGWVAISLRPDDQREYIRAFHLQIAILSNHQNGRDTHIRQISIFGPKHNAVQAAGLPSEFRTLEFQMYASLR